MQKNFFPGRQWQGATCAVAVAEPRVGRLEQVPMEACPSGHPGSSAQYADPYKAAPQGGSFLQ